MLVKDNSLVTLHYEISLAETGRVYLSTYGSSPATLQLGSEELAPNLQKLLLGLQEDEEREFILMPEESFGCHNPDLVYAFDISLLQKFGPDVTVGSALRLESPDGSLLNCTLKDISSNEILLDFNHPLAGEQILFRVNIISIL